MKERKNLILLISLIIYLVFEIINLAKDNSDILTFSNKDKSSVVLEFIIVLIMIFNVIYKNKYTNYIWLLTGLLVISKSIYYSIIRGEIQVGSFLSNIYFLEILSIYMVYISFVELKKL